MKKPFLVRRCKLCVQRPAIQGSNLCEVCEKNFSNTMLNNAQMPQDELTYEKDGGTRYEVSYITKMGIRRVERFGIWDNALKHFEKMKEQSAAGLRFVDTAGKPPVIIDSFSGSRKV